MSRSLFRVVTEHGAADGQQGLLPGPAIGFDAHQYVSELGAVVDEPSDEFPESADPRYPFR